MLFIPSYWPSGWRKGQAISNFCKWLELKGKDPFYVEDKEWDKLWLEFMKENYKKEKHD